VLFLVAACSRKPELVEFVAPEANLVVSMPQPVEHRTRDATLGDTQITAHAYAASFDGVAYVLNFQPIPEVLREQARRVPLDEKLASGQAELVRSTGGRATAQVGAMLPTATGRWLGREVTLALPDGRHRMVVRLFPTDAWYVQVAVTLPVEPSYHQELYATRFLDSVRMR
jgi:hypothetical protein